MCFSMAKSTQNLKVFNGIIRSVKVFMVNIYFLISTTSLANFFNSNLFNKSKGNLSTDTMFFYIREISGIKSFRVFLVPFFSAIKKILSPTERRTKLRSPFWRKYFFAYLTRFFFINVDHNYCPIINGICLKVNPEGFDI